MAGHPLRGGVAARWPSEDAAGAVSTSSTNDVVAAGALIEPVEIRSNSSKLPPRATWAEIAPFLRPFWRSAPLGATSERGGAA